MATVRVILLASLVVSFQSFGAEDQSDATTSNLALDRVIVTATRTFEDESRIGSAFSQLTGEQLETEQIIDLKNALNTTPGAFSLEGGARGGFTTVSIRGNSTSYTLILVDGIKVNTGMFSDAAPFLDFAQTLNLDTVDIVRGPYSTLYGSDAIGGVVSLITHQGSGTSKAMLFGEAGTFDSLRAGLVSDGQIGKIDYSFHYVHDETANARPNNYLRVNGYSLRLDATLSPSVTLGMTVRGQYGQYEEPSSDRPVDVPFDDPHAKATGETNLLTLFLNWKTADWWNQRFLVGGYSERYTFTDPPIPTQNFPGSLYIAKALNLQADWQNTFELPAGNVAVAGATYYLEAGHDNTFPLHEQNNFALYLQDQWEVIPNLTLTAGGRYDHYEYAGNAFTYRFTGAYLFTPTNTKLRASYGTAFKAPDLFNTFSISPAALGNPNLKPEKSQGFDVGIDQSFGEGRIAISASFFHNYIDDVIAFVPSGLLTGSYENQNTGETYGIESEFRAVPLKNWEARGAFTWTESYFTSAGITRRSIYMPRYQFSFDTNYKFPFGLTVGFGALFVGQREGEDFSFFPAEFLRLGDYWNLRAYARWELNSHFALTFRGENLADQHYQTTIGFPALGTTLFCGAEIRF
ncbi:MAG: TonB-dependent receptor [Verrucomicrobia bacterium]|nr:TonB-dependent receptor [Verrucomicrobiota bacterium]